LRLVLVQLNTFDVPGMAYRNDAFFIRDEIFGRDFFTLTNKLSAALIGVLGLYGSELAYNKLHQK
jgi:hypothetical protein